MSFLLDTNMVSEWMKPRPNSGVVAWTAEVDEDRVFLSVITLAELRHGIDRMPVGARKKRLNEWLEQDLPLRFEHRTLGIDAATANVCGKLIAISEARGKRIEVMDAFVAATAALHQLIIVTRNVSDFEAITTDILNPWV